MKEFLKTFEDCIQWERPPCATACPFNLDVFDFQEKVARGSFMSAYRTYRNAVGFPDIVARLCPAWCQAACPRKTVDTSVRLDLIERACVELVKRKDPTDYNVPVKEQRIAIIGAGPAGLGCALRLASKRYQVVVYEAGSEKGGSLDGLLSPDIYLTDIERQMRHLEIDWRFDQQINTAEELAAENFNAVFVATGQGGNDFGLLTEQPACAIREDRAWFAGGGLTGLEPVAALAQGLAMAWAIEVYLKTDKLEYPKTAEPSRTVVNQHLLTPTPMVEAQSADGIYTDEETIAEAGRCIRCQCDICRTDCDLCRFYNRWPLKIRDEIMSTTMSHESQLNPAPAKRLINTCTQCGLFEERCPASIDLGEMILEARRRLHRQDTMPRAFHQFWLEDMAYANGEWAAVCKPAPAGQAAEVFAAGKGKTKDVFFPGCQMGASAPDLVLYAYRRLLALEPATGIMLRCCGVPVEWAGDDAAFQLEIESLRAEWKSLGQPRMVMACPTCMRMFKRHLPEIPLVSLYEVLVEAEDKASIAGTPVAGASAAGASAVGTSAAGAGTAAEEAVAAAGPAVVHVFDACSARNEAGIQQAVRQLLDSRGYQLSVGEHPEKEACCGYGGQPDVANPEFARFVAKSRIAADPAPFVTYCINCRDIFLGEGKPACHILEIIEKTGKKATEQDRSPALTQGREVLPDLTARRRNRTQLKQNLLKEFWEEIMPEKPREYDYQLQIDPELRKKMDQQKILEDDICKVIDLAEQLDRRIYRPETDSYVCYRELGAISLWVEYRGSGDDREIINIYTHRVKIELEMVYNGRKTDFDLQ
ncbi:MAG TPA: NAD(P)-binding protein [Clostridiales bacterium]|nr:NAD(P)-binding protein [Clostridiales bacterium]